MGKSYKIDYGCEIKMPDESLYGKKREDYGEKYQEHFLEQYKLYVAGIENISDRRKSANRYFIAINGSILAAFIISARLNYRGEEIYSLILLIVGFLINFAITCLLFSYKTLNTAKFEVLSKIEKNLPLRMYDLEWEILNEKKRWGHFPLSHFEILISTVITIAYFFILFSIILLK